jgi:hypothetical protein
LEEVKVTESLKQKKKRNRKKKATTKVDSDEEFLEQVIQKSSQPKGKRAIEMGDSVLLMDRQFFNYRKELRTLFTQL